MNNSTRTILKPYNVSTRTTGCTNSQRNGTLEEKSSGYLWYRAKRANEAINMERMINIKNMGR